MPAARTSPGRCVGGVVATVVQVRVHAHFATVSGASSGRLSLRQAPLAARMMLAVQILQALAGDMRVNLGGRQVTVAQQQLNDS